MFNAIKKYRIARCFYVHHLTLLAKIIEGIIYICHNSFIPCTAEIGEGTVFAYKGIATVVHKRTKIGKNCVIGTNVTIGGGGGKSCKLNSDNDSIRRDVPVIGDNVYISTGAKVIGPIVIGNNVTIGANAVVVDDIPSNVVVGGCPHEF